MNAAIESPFRAVEVDCESVRATVAEILDADGVRASAAMLTGSFARGEADATSDVDVHVIHRQDWWQKREVVRNGRIFEIVAAPLQYYRRQVQDGVVVLHLILYDAVILWDEDGAARALVDTARTRPKPRSPAAPRGLDVLTRHRPWSLFLDLEAFRIAGDAGGFAYTAGCLMDLAITHWTRREIGFLDVKQRYRAMGERFPALRFAVDAYAEAAGLDRRAACLRRVLDLAYESSGGVSTTGQTERVPWSLASRYMR